MKAKIFTCACAAALFLTNCQSNASESKNAQKLQVVSASLVSALEKPELTAVTSSAISNSDIEMAESTSSSKLMTASEESPKPKKIIKKPIKKAKKKSKISYNKTGTTPRTTSRTTARAIQREPKEGDVIFSYFIPNSTVVTTSKVETAVKTPMPSTNANGSVSTTSQTKMPSTPRSSGTSFERVGRDEVFKISEVKPSYPGGEREMGRFLSNSIRYPSKAREEQIEGTVFMQFVVEKDGTVDDISVAKGVHPLLDAEAKRVVSQMPKWAAGRQNGRDVAVQYTLPVRFQLID